jgi:hypothetical protein
MASFKALLIATSPDLAVCVRGRHAVGKSEGVYQAAAGRRSEAYKDPRVCADMVKRFGGAVKHESGIKNDWTYDDGVPVMERRLSQMTEGDTIGLPFDSGHGTVFKPCDWLYTSCDFPVVLFLDERNRALPGVKQSVFQLCDSKAFYGNRLHNETRVVIAENVGDEYQVEACDPAEVSRTAVVVLDPDEREWLNYAEGKCDLATIEFIRTNANKLEHKGMHEPNKKYPDRRAWFKLDQELQSLGLFDKPEDPMFYILCGAMIGPEVGAQFTHFCKERDRQVSAKDIAENWQNAKHRLARKGSISNENYIECAAKLGDYLKENIVTEHQAHQLALYMFDCPSELFLTTWCSLTSVKENISALHPYIKELLVAIATGKGTAASIVCPTLEHVTALREKPLASGKVKKAASAKRGAHAKGSK